VLEDARQQVTFAAEWWNAMTVSVRPIIQRRVGEATPLPYDRLVVGRPSDEWSRQVEKEAAELASGSRSPEQVYARILWPESLRSRTDAALAEFEVDLHALRQPSDEEILDVVERLVLTLNKINEDQVRADEIGYETGEREELCDYITASLQAAGIDVVSLEIRHGAPPGDIAGRWRDW
jgi:nucleotide-binding universal stress UspA family protein